MTRWSHDEAGDLVGAFEVIKERFRPGVLVRLLNVEDYCWDFEGFDVERAEIRTVRTLLLAPGPRVLVCASNEHAAHRTAWVKPKDLEVVS